MVGLVCDGWVKEIFILIILIFLKLCNFYSSSFYQDYLIKGDWFKLTQILKS